MGRLLGQAELIMEEDYEKKKTNRQRKGSIYFIDFIGAGGSGGMEAEKRTPEGAAAKAGNGRCAASEGGAEGTGAGTGTAGRRA